MRNNRAFDTGSAKIWDSINRGVRDDPVLEETCANPYDSDNGRTSSSATWRLPRTTSRDVATQRFGPEIDTSLRFGGQT
jgi:hypothetical protein